jgi:uncharacterized protein YbjT (DUF2867 family)
MRETPTLVTGATGKLGTLITRELLRLGHPIRILVRRPDAARIAFGPAPEIAAGDFDDPASVAKAVAGVERIVLLSPIDSRLAEHQITVIEAAEAAGVKRIVKISGSDWTFGPEGPFSGHAHQRIENRLVASPLASVAIRPNAWMQTSLAPLAIMAQRGEPLYGAHGTARISYVDARDIRDVAIHQLFADTVEPSPLILTGDEALTLAEVATIAGRILGRTIGTTDVPPAQPGHHGNAFEAGIVNQFLVLLRAGKAAPMTDTVRRLLQRPARRAEDLLAELLTAPVDSDDAPAAA